jgi:hypothetical protein
MHAILADDEEGVDRILDQQGVDVDDFQVYRSVGRGPLGVEGEVEGWDIGSGGVNAADEGG